MTTNQHPVYNTALYLLDPRLNALFDLRRNATAEQRHAIHWALRCAIGEDAAVLESARWYRHHVEEDDTNLWNAYCDYEHFLNITYGKDIYTPDRTEAFQEAQTYRRLRKEYAEKIGKEPCLFPDESYHDFVKFYLDNN